MGDVFSAPVSASKDFSRFLTPGSKSSVTETDCTIGHVLTVNSCDICQLSMMNESTKSEICSVIIHQFHELICPCDIRGRLNN